MILCRYWIRNIKPVFYERHANIFIREQTHAKGCKKGFKKYHHIGQKIATTLAAIFVFISNFFKIILKLKNF